MFRRRLFIPFYTQVAGTSSLSSHFCELCCSNRHSQRAGCSQRHIMYPQGPVPFTEELKLSGKIRKMLWKQLDPFICDTQAFSTDAHESLLAWMKPTTPCRSLHHEVVQTSLVLSRDRDSCTCRELLFESPLVLVSECNTSCKILTLH